MATVKDRVVELCKAKGITVNRLQKETGIGNVVAHWDLYNPRIVSLAKVAAYLDVPMEYLATGEMPEEKENPAASSGNEVDDAVHSLVINLFDRLSPDDQKELIADLISKARNQ